MPHKQDLIFLFGLDRDSLSPVAAAVYMANCIAVQERRRDQRHWTYDHGRHNNMQRAYLAFCNAHGLHP